MERSVLELVIGGVPFPHGLPNGDWGYRHAVRPEGPSPLDYQCVSDFLNYEEAYERSVTVVADPSLKGWDQWRPPADRPHPGLFFKQCCSHAYADGCGGRLVCHGTPAAAAAEILRHGALAPATEVFGRTGGDLAHDSSWGDPADYFEHVNFANGSCTAPEAVAYSRQLKRDLVPADLLAGYPPAVRFYFDWASLSHRRDARFDGVHPIKIAGEVPLGSLLVAAVVHANLWPVLADVVPAELVDRMVVLETSNPGPDQWATAALVGAEVLAQL